MALQDDCDLWNRCEDDAGIGLSEIGPNGIVTLNPTYGAVKFNNGIKSTGADYARFPNAHPGGVSIAEFRWIPDYASGVGGVRVPYSTLDAGANDSIQVIHNFPTYTIGLFAYDGGARRSQYRYNTAWGAGTLHHILIVVDSAAGPTNRFKFYFDTVLQIPVARPEDNAFTFADMDAYTSFPTITNNSALDNLKIYHSAGQLAGILANWQNEAWPVTGGGRLINGGLLRPNLLRGGVLIG